jgi:hypothetical protein
VKENFRTVKRLPIMSDTEDLKDYEQPEDEVNGKEVSGPQDWYTLQDASNQEVVEEWKNMSPEDQRAFERKLLWKLDMRLIPWLTFLYLLSFLDRTNIGNAKIEGVWLP